MAKEKDWSDWGPLADRYRPTRPRRVLALDGGGIRGLLTLGVLAELETQLRDRCWNRYAGNDEPADFRLCQFFYTWVTRALQQQHQVAFGVYTYAWCGGCIAIETSTFTSGAPPKTNGMT